MSYRNIVRAWKDPEYRLGLSAAEQARLPDNPAGLVELVEADLGATLGGADNDGTSHGCVLDALVWGTWYCLSGEIACTANP